MRTFLKTVSYFIRSLHLAALQNILNRAVNARVKKNKPINSPLLISLTNRIARINTKLNAAENIIRAELGNYDKKK